MELKDLIEAVEAATTKDGLEALVLRELGIDVDKRKRLSDIRAEVLSGLGVEAGADKPEGNGGQGEDEASELEGDDGGEPGSNPSDESPAPADLVADGLAGTGAAGDGTAIQPPAPEVEPPKPAIPEVKNRLLRNKSTGRTFIWTKELANLPVMEEI